MRLSGDYSTDKNRARFPKYEAVADTGTSAQELFEKWVAERNPAAGTIESWRYVFRGLSSHLEGRSASSISPEEADAWIQGLIKGKRSSGVVKKTWLTAAKTVFDWGGKRKLIRLNPFAQVVVTVQKKKRSRTTKAFQKSEMETILRAASDIKEFKGVDDVAKRWVPWICAYTGARSGEISQLRGMDVIEREGVHALHLTPDAGTIKGGIARDVPIHEHLVAQGFLAFVEQRGKGPLFYEPSKKHSTAKTSLHPRKAQAAQIRQRLAAWVRTLGVSDPELAPNHAWRHTFKQIADRAGITERVSDVITGHAASTVGRAYGPPTLSDMAEALNKFPRYEI